MSNPKIYVAGFLFNADKARVLLVRKTRPEWQVGLLNGIGGKIEDMGESAEEAMVREFKEEVGWDPKIGWDFFCVEEGPGYQVYFFRSTLVSPEIPWAAPSVNDVGEPLAWYDLPLKEPAVGNLNWLIPLALDPRHIKVSAGALVGPTIGDLKTW
jgi:8-oxo-dGTP pyrophosphatase MutT (NUDIX family)